jgi:translocator protein
MARRSRIPAVLTGVGIVAVTVGVAAAGTAAGDFDSRWYRRLRKPGWQPGGATIGTVWTMLYALTGASAYILARGARQRRGLLGSLFVLQYALNAAFTPLLTRRHDLTLATADSAALLATVSALTVAAWPVRRSAAILLLPYVIWTAFATYLSATLVRLNRPG